MSKKWIYIVTLWAIVWGLPSTLVAQITVQQVPAGTFQFGKTELFNFQVSNAGKGQRVSFTLTVKDARAKPLVTYHSHLTELASGLTPFHQGNLTVARMEFANSEAKQALTAGRSLPEGAYIACVDVKPVGSGFAPLAQSCMEVSVEPLSPVILQYPFNEAEVTEAMPLFTWTPVVSTHSRAYTYQIKVVEVLAHQQGVEALMRNPALFHQKSLRSPQTLYPVNTRALKDEGEYAWQVKAYYEGELISTSEIWQFTRSKREEPNVEPNGIYVELGTTHAEVLKIEKHLQFKTPRDVPSESLKYEIYQANGAKKVKKITKLESPSGDGRYSIDVTEIRGLKKGDPYLLKVIRPNGQVYGLSFQLKNK